MNNLDLIRLTLKNFMRRKIRTFLTILGVIIGTAAIVVMLSLGIGMNESFKKEISRMGSLNVITVTQYYYSEEMMRMGGQPSRTVLDDESVAKIKKLEGVKAVSPMMQTSLKIVSGKYTTYGNIMGIDPSTMEEFDYKLAEGRLLTEDDTAALVFGSTTPMNFYNPKSSGRTRVFYFGGMGGSDQKPPVDVLNDKLEMTFDMSYGERRPIGITQNDEQNNKPAKLYKAKGVGLLEQSQNEKDYYIYMNIEYLKKLIRENSKNQATRYASTYQNQGYEQVLVKVENINDVSRITKEINEMGYGAQSLADILKSMQKTASTIQAVLGGIGAISLLVAALGITNTMIMSIFERTREIGIMKVLGCLLKDIRRLFLIEAGMIGFMGGIIGLLFSFGASYLLNIVGGGILGGGAPPGPDGERNAISVIPVWLALSSIGFATMVGLISGFYPARRAMKLSALEAIKTE
jgi:putative ABC transport system permease protein